MNRSAALLLRAALLCVAGVMPLPALSENLTIYQATLGETDQKASEVSTEQFRQILASGEAIVIDSRPHAEFVNGHVPGAVDAAGKDAVAAIEKLVKGDKAKALVLYCNGPFCQASRRLGAELVKAGFTNVRRYQLGMPVWRALGGPTEIEIEGVERVFKNDQTAVFLDARPAADFARGSLPNASNLTPGDAAEVKGKPMPLDDFDTRIILFGKDGAEARKLADALSERPWHNVSYFAGSYEDLNAALKK